MARNKLSEARCRTLVEVGVHGDGDGLWLRVHKSGSKNWVFIYRRGTARHEIGLGGYGQGTAPVSLALAREKAEVIRQQLARGEDPMAPLKAATEKAPVTFGECVENLLKVKAAELKSKKHLDQWTMTLERYASPLHPLPVATITVDDVVTCLTPHWLERQETADRLRARIAAVIDYARARGLREAGNPAQWHGLLDTLLPTRKALQRGHHHAVDYHIVPTLMAGLRGSTGLAARAVEFLALTATRSGEVRGSTWPEIDLDKFVWTIPAARMKAEREHRVPLSQRAVNILQAMKERATGEHVFGGERDGRPISDTAMVKALRRASPDKAATLHGLRSSFRDWAGDETDHARDVAEQALAHVVQGVEAAYRRKDALEKRRKLMDEWESFCSSAKTFSA